MIGSRCFAFGSGPAIAAAVGGAVVCVCFIGALFCTSTAYLRSVEASNGGDDILGAVRTRGPLAIRLHPLGWWAASSQPLGTLGFDATAAVPPAIGGALGLDVLASCAR